MITFRLHRKSYNQVSSTEFMNFAEDIWLGAQEYNGEFALRKHSIDFYIPEKHTIFFGIRYPFLERVVD